MFEHAYKRANQPFFFTIYYFWPRDNTTHFAPRSQGLNTGVVLYDLHKMRDSSLYGSYLNREAVEDLMDR